VSCSGEWCRRTGADLIARAMGVGGRTEGVQMKHFDKRLRAVEARLGAQDISMQAVVEAEQRIQKRARLKIARRLHGSDNHSLVPDALAELAEESPEQAEQDEALVHRWRQAKGLVVDAHGARRRIAHRLDEMAERQHANATVASCVVML
jgi:hypothetical protein